MNRKYNKWLFGGALGLLTVFGFSSCTDDHYDINNATTAKGTLWENMLATQKCDSFAMILSKTIVDKKDYGTPATLTYEQLLKSNKVMTVWAPKDGTYNAAKWLNMLSDASNKKANEQVEQQFVANHIAYFNYNGSYPVSQRILLANDKYATYDAGGKTFMDVPISSDYTNVPSTNGTLHLIESQSPFLPNLREVLQLYPSLSKIYEYMESRDTVVFSESASTPGTTVEGKVHYVDSVFYKYNKVYPSIAENEDSLCAAIIPSNQAWEEAIAKISPYYNYKSRYAYHLAEDGKYSLDTIKADSVKEAMTINAIVNNMFYSLHEQPSFDVENASVSTVGDFFRSCDSLMSVNYYSNTDRYHQHAPECWELAEGKDPIEVSNGYAFITDHFNFTPSKAWQYDVEVEAEDSWYIDTNSNFTKNTSTINPTGITQTVSEGTVNPNVIGKVSGSKFREVSPRTNNAKLWISYNLPSILSGTYDIYVVMLPENITDSLLTKVRSTKFKARITPEMNDYAVAQNQVTSEDFITTPGAIDTILLFENYKFPYAYAGLPNAKPCITLMGNHQSAINQCSTLRIDKFILKAKDE